MSSQNTDYHNISIANNKKRYVTLTVEALVSGLICAIAAVICYETKLPLWAMFIGWVVLHTREVILRKAVASWINLTFGISLGMAATLFVERMIPSIHMLALPLAVFLTTIVIVLVRAARPVDNAIATFLGLIAFLASHLEPTWPSLALLVVATTLGLLAAWVAHLAFSVRFGPSSE